MAQVTRDGLISMANGHFDPAYDFATLTLLAAYDSQATPVAIAVEAVRVEPVPAPAPHGVATRRLQAREVSDG